MADPASEVLMQRAERSLPGGVNSPVRAFRAVGGNPVFVARAKGSRITGADGREYLDYVGSWGPAILGHAHAKVVGAVVKAAADGLSFGAPTERETLFAEAIKERYPSMELLRCVSSGTEATMSALRVARGFTQRDVIVKCDGAYHGHADALLVRAGSGLATLGTPDSAGVPPNLVQTTMTVAYNDATELERLFTRHAGRIAAVIVEPVAGNMGCVPPEPGYLEAVVGLSERHGALAIFDEVMTGCRVARGGAQERYGVVPHLTCLGKVVGGGMPLAVYGGKKEVMQLVAPLGPVYQAGTLSGNPLAVSAGLATLAELTPDVYARLESLGEQLQIGLERAVRDGRAKARVQRVGSMITLFFHDGSVRNWLEASASDRERFGAFHRQLLERGVYWPPSQFEAAFVSAAHSADEIDATVRAATEALAAIK